MAKSVADGEPSTLARAGQAEYAPVPIDRAAPWDRYGRDVLAADPHRAVGEQPPTVTAAAGLVVEHPVSGWVGAVVATDALGVSLEDRHGKVRIFTWSDRFALEGRLVSLARPAVGAPGTSLESRRSRSGSRVVDLPKARVARASRIYVEGLHDAALVEQVWGHDLRVEGIVVEPLHGIDDLPGVVEAFAPARGRRLGVLVDHLVPGSKESRVSGRVRSPHVLVTGHPYVDVWQAVKPASMGIREWPSVPMGVAWKQGISEALGAADEETMWRRVLASVQSHADLEVPLLRAVEALIDFVTAED